mmetsp:Transcript_658/g.1851  ORF Transcript_658/g.1851 Transcript_658/m.1851 type:complete len:96 (+) Transcript_658:366-653(+)|eukprot:CAMPEP_0198133418 /NCGR_PEP_ID=MMETSP1442-20131203/59553_1 /TAXON_ID= /ORGANISM="Craspedostauros australis, Strain CCMP3328" /LENGTH=95 /DNA_ID=CAMNT_0043794535 /DNA_START=780 /DNA_END=1067 /DNA_ORIENTATION=+
MAETSPTRKVHDGAVDGNRQDLSLFVQDMLDQMNESFTATGNTIIGRMDEVGKRMDDLEIRINDLMEQAGLDEPQTKANGRDGNSSIESNTSVQV